MDSSARGNQLRDSDAIFRIAAFQYHEPLANIMEREVFTCSPEDPVRSVAKQMARQRISSAVVIDSSNRPVGIVTERDIVREVIADDVGDGKIISDIMTRDPVSLPPDGTLFDVMSVLHRYEIKHLPIVDEGMLKGIITLRQIMKIRYAEPFSIIGKLEKADTVDDFKNIKEELIYLVKDKLAENTDPADIVTMLSLVHSGMHRRLLSWVMAGQANPPPVDFCFFVTGSHGRKETLLFPDQDFCVIMDDYPDKDDLEYDGYFYDVSKKLSECLNGAGFPFCQGNIMGQNPQMRRRISGWQSFITDAIKSQGPYTVRYMTLIFDSARLYGSHPLFDTYMDHAYREISHNRNVLRQMHEEEEGTHKVPLGIFQHFITETDKDHNKVIDMKKSGLIFLIEAARILALKHNVRETSTLTRIQALAEKNVIQKDDSEYFENAYRVILYHTLNAQVEHYLVNGTNDYYLSPHELSQRNQGVLKEAFKAISTLQGIVRSEFGEL